VSARLSFSLSSEKESRSIVAYVIENDDRIGLGLFPFGGSVAARTLAARIAAAKAALVRTKPSVVPVVSLTKFYWFNASTGKFAETSSRIAPAGTGWVLQANQAAAVAAGNAWLRARAVTGTLIKPPVIGLRPPVVAFKDYIPLKPPVIAIRPMIDEVPLIQKTKFWAMYGGGKVVQSVGVPDRSMGWRAFAAQKDALAFASGAVTAPVVSLPPVGKPTVVTLPTGVTVAAKPVMTAGGQVVTVPAGTPVPVVMPSGEIRQVDSMAVAAATPVEAGADKILGLPPMVVYLGGAALFFFVLMPMMNKGAKGR
jgi:hypothetical protein